MFKVKNYSRGFTLIELLVVISIIGIMASVVLASLETARAKARDATRLAQLKQLQSVLETYYSGPGTYPSTGGAWWGASNNGGNRDTSGVNAYIPGVTPDYIAELPLDPSGDISGWSGYLYQSDGNNYKLLIHANGPESFPSASDPHYDPIRPTWAWMICSGEPACSGW